MSNIEIIAYTVVNGEMHHSPKHFKHCFINSIEEAEPFKEKVKKRWEKKLGSPCEVYPTYRHMDEIYPSLMKKKGNGSKKKP